MVASQNQTYTAAIPGQPAGTSVNYTVLACDTSGNSAEASGSYEVKNWANITLNLQSTSVYCGKDITVTGSTPANGANVTLTYAILTNSTVNSTVLDSAVTTDAIWNYTSNTTAVSRVASTDILGNFRDVCVLNKTGKWVVWASWNGSETYFADSSCCLKFAVKKMLMSVTCNITSKTITIGDNVTATGQVYPATENITVTVTFMGSNSTIEQTAITHANGTYRVSWKPDAVEMWRVHAQITETTAISAAYSNSTSVKVNDTFLNQYMLYIIGGVGGVAGVGVVVFIRRRRYE
jgi:hypothetical protein